MRIQGDVDKEPCAMDSMETPVWWVRVCGRGSAGLIHARGHTHTHTHAHSTRQVSQLFRSLK